MKKLNRWFIIVLTLVLFVASLNTTSFAAETRASDYFSKSNVYISRTTGNTFKIAFSVEAPRTMKEIGVKYIKIQRSTNGTSWTTVTTLYESSYPSFIVTNTDENSSSVTYTGTSGYYYRAYAHFYASNSSGSGTKIVYSNVL